MATRVIMPEMGEGVIEGTVSRWLKQEGDEVEEFEPILEIETDKVTTEATSEVGGTLLKIYVNEGETVPVGTLLAVIGQPGEAIPDEAGGAQEGEEVALQEVAAADAASARGQEATGHNGHAAAEGERDEEMPFANWVSPVVKRIAAEHNVDLDKVEGSGRGGRTTKKDILAYLERREEMGSRGAPQRATPEPVPAGVAEKKPPAAPVQSEPVPGEVVPLSNMRRRIAEHMVASKHTSPHVTTVFEVDFSAVVTHRNAHKQQFAQNGVNLTFTPYIVAATAQALRAHPMVNSSWTEEGVALKQEINIGMATALEDGLIVPVIKNADHYNLLGLASQVNDLAERARSNRLQPAEVQGGTFSITNHGVSGSLFATPIINQPQCGILGIGKIEKRVKVIDDAIAIRPLAFVSFTFDHRILDGATADYFVATVKEIIETWPLG
jgi:2-oxoglutarate dehydrogenase E2 component (dihydrolipoamide succinyltransferase)